MPAMHAYRVERGDIADNSVVALFGGWILVHASLGQLVFLGSACFWTLHLSFIHFSGKRH